MKYSLGIDLGSSFTTACVYEYSADNSRPIFIKEEGDAKIPSVVYWSDQGPVFGTKAEKKREEAFSGKNPEKSLDIFLATKDDFKRELNNTRPCITLRNGKNISYLEVCTEFFRYLKNLAENQINQKKSDGEQIRFFSVCLTHPVNFDPTQLNILKEAAYLAGFTRGIKLLSEPVAAVWGYAALQSQNTFLKNAKGILAFDFGGGTLDVAYVERQDDGNYIADSMLSAGRNIGGKDIDRLLAVEFIRNNKLQRRTSSAERNAESSAIIGACERLKKALSEKRNHQEQVKTLDGNVIKYAMTRDGLEAILRTPRNHEQDIELANTGSVRQMLSDLLKKISARNKKIDAIIPIGGSVRMPIVQAILNNASPDGATVCKLLDDDTAVACGAAVYGAHSSVFFKAQILLKQINSWNREMETLKRAITTH